MYEKRVQITNDLTRIAAVELVKAAKSFVADIIVTNNGKSANAKDLFKVESLRISSGDIVNISADGPQAQQGVDHLYTLLVS